MVQEVFFAPVEYETESPLLLADSGAFSAWNSYQTISLERYACYIHAAREWIFSAVNLDVIPGRVDEWGTPNEAEAACIASYDDWRRLRETGVNVLPVSHQGDDIRWLYRYLAKGATLVGIPPST